MRKTFIAIPVPSAAQSQLARYITELTALFPEGGFRFIPQDQLHVTISFLGDQTDEEIGQTAAALTAVAPMLEFPPELRFDQISYWPHAEDPSAIILSADGVSGDGLLGVREDVENGLLAHEIRFRPDNRRFVAHITLARRTKESVLLPELLMAADVSFAPEELHYYESLLSGGSVVYETLMSTPIEPAI